MLSKKLTALKPQSHTPSNFCFNLLLERSFALLQVDTNNPKNVASSQRPQLTSCSMRFSQLLSDTKQMYKTHTHTYVKYTRTHTQFNCRRCICTLVAMRNLQTCLNCSTSFKKLHTSYSLHTLFETKVCRRIDAFLDYYNFTFQKHVEMKVSSDTLDT